MKAWLWVAVAALGSVSTAAVEIPLERHLDEVPGEAQLVLTPAEGDPQIRLPLAEAGEELEVATGWAIHCEGGIWCPRTVIGEDSIPLPIFPAMRVVGALRSNERLPATVRVQTLVDTSPGRPQVEVDLVVPVSEEQVEVYLPKVALDLRLAFANAAPIYRWNVSPPGGSDAQTGTIPEVDIGPLTLTDGGSFIGWARRFEDRSPLPGASIVASLAGETKDDLEALFRSVRGKADDKGFFQLTGLQAGIWSVEIHADGRAARHLREVEVQGGAETLIGDVLLAEPSTVLAILSPPVHPDGTPWHLVVRPDLGMQGDEALTLRVPEDGRLEVSGLRPTDYDVRVQGPNGDNYLVQTLGATPQARWDLRVPLVEVTGTLHLGGEPLAGTVRLETGSADRVEVESDEDGAFGGWMHPPTRPWMMATVSWLEAGEARRRLLEVVPEVEDGEVELEIDLPAGVVHGSVVGQDGHLAPGVRVDLTPANRVSSLTSSTTRTDDDGRFHFSGLASGEYHVQAGGNGWPASELVTVDLDGRLPAASVRLALQATRELQLRATRGGLPVTGARLRLDTLGAAPVSIESVTDLRGGALLTVPRSTEVGVVTVLAPGRPPWSSCQRLDEATIEVALPTSEPGRLELVTTGRLDLPPLLAGDNLIVTEDGGVLFENALRTLPGARRRATADEDDPDSVTTTTSVALPPGRYLVSRSAAPAWAIATRACAGGFTAEISAQVTPGGVASAVLDLEERQRERLEELRGRRR